MAELHFCGGAAWGVSMDDWARLPAISQICCRWLDRGGGHLDHAALADLAELADELEAADARIDQDEQQGEQAEACSFYVEAIACEPEAYRAFGAFHRLRL